MYNIDNTFIDISGLLLRFKLKHKIFEGNGQQDTQEFYNIFLDDINNDLNMVKKRPDYREIKYTDIHSKIISGKEFFDYFINMKI